MLKHEFYGQYANTPIPDRSKSVLLMTEHGYVSSPTLQEIYHSINEKDNRRRDLESEIDSLLGLAEQIMKGEKYGNLKVSS